MSCKILFPSCVDSAAEDACTVSLDGVGLLTLAEIAASDVLSLSTERGHGRDRFGLREAA